MYVLPTRLWADGEDMDKPNKFGRIFDRLKPLVRFFVEIERPGGVYERQLQVLDNAILKMKLEPHKPKHRGILCRKPNRWLNRKETTG